LLPDNKVDVGDRGLPQTALGGHVGQSADMIPFSYDKSCYDILDDTVDGDYCYEENK